MGVDRGAELSRTTPPLPRSIWVVAWASLMGQSVLLVGRGGRVDDGVSMIMSVVLGALLVGYISVGVVRARTVRLGFAWAVLVLSVIVGFLDLTWADDLGQAAVAAISLATTAVAIAGLGRFHRTEWFAWQRTKPSAHEGAPVGRLVAVGVLVGVLGGLIEPAEDGLNVRISVTGPLTGMSGPMSIVRE